MTIRYVNTFRDMVAFARYHYVRNWVMQLTLALFVVFTLWTSVRRLDPGDSLVVKILTVVIVEMLLVAGVLALVALATVLSMVSSRNKTILTEHTITLAPDGLTEQTAFKTTVHNWSAVQKVARTDKYLFVYVSQHAAHVIPRRAVSSQPDWDALCDFICKSAP
jgi:hypothetical protein